VHFLARIQAFTDNTGPAEAAVVGRQHCDHRDECSPADRSGGQGCRLRRGIV